MKKNLTCLLFCCAWLPFAAACGSRSFSIPSSANTMSAATDKKEPVSIGFAWWGNQVRSDGTLQVLQNYSESNTDVIVEPYLSEWTDYWSALATSAAGHILPDVIQMDYYYLNQFSEKELLVDLLPYVVAGVIDTSSQSEEILADWTVDGRLMAISGGVSAPALIYNKTLLDSLGIQVKDRMTTKEFIEIARTVYQETGIRTNIAYGVEGFLEYFCRAYDEAVYGETGAGVTRKTLEKYYRLYEQGFSEGWLIDPGAFADITVGSVEQDPMVSGENAAMSSWCDFAYSYQMHAIQQAAPADVVLGIAAWPSDQPEKSVYLRPGPALSVSVDTQDAGEAAKLIGYMTDPKIQLTEIQGERGIPYTYLTGEEELPVSDKSNQAVIRYLKEVVQPVASPINPPAPFWAGQAYGLNGTLVEKICYGECTAAEAAEEFLRGCSEFQK